MKDSEHWKHRVEDLIGSGALIVNDGYRAKNSELSFEGLPFARAGNINSGFDFHRADRFPTENLHRVGSKLSQPGDVLFTSKGTVGRFGFVRENTEQFVYSPQLCFWRARDKSVIEPRFLYYWMHGAEFTEQCNGVKGQTDMADYVSLRDQRKMYITLPPLEEQRAIASVLGSLDDKIELNRRMNETLEEIARALFKSWFVDFDPVRARREGRQPAGVDDETAALFPDSFENSALGEIPKGWSAGSLGDIAEKVRRGVDPTDISPSTPYIGLDHMPRKSIALSEWGKAEQVASNKSVFRQEEILFGKLRPYFHKVGVAPVDGVCSTDILVVTPRQPHWYGLALSHLSSDALVNHADATSSGTRMPRAKWSDLARYQIAIPFEEVAERFTRMAQPLVQAIQSNIHQARTLAAIRDALLPKLLSGEVRVEKTNALVEEAT